MRFADMKASFLFVLGSLLPACGGQALDVGSSGEAGTTTSGGSSTTSGGTSATSGAMSATSGGSSPTAAGSPPAGGSSNDPSWPDPAECGSDASNSLQGTWTGYAQGEGHDYDFRLVLAGNSDAPCGTLTFGEPQSYPPATDPETPYPPSWSDFKFLERLPGFSYSLLSVERDGSRLQFRLGYAQPYASWCSLQTSYPQRGEGYSCLPQYGDGALVMGDQCIATGAGAEGHVYPCAHFSACLSAVQPPCACDASGCAANMEDGHEYFDLRFDESEASGEMTDKIVFLEKE